MSNMYTITFSDLCAANVSSKKLVNEHVCHYFSEEETWKQVRPDYMSTWTLISAFFVLVFNFVLLET